MEFTIIRAYNHCTDDQVLFIIELAFERSKNHPLRWNVSIDILDFNGDYRNISRDRDRDI